MSFLSKSSCYAFVVVLDLLLGLAGSSYGADSGATPGQVATVVAKVSPAVVRIIAVQPPNPEDGKSGPPAVGSGFIIDPSGFVATNKHVVKDAAAIFVTTADGVRYQASVVGMPGTVDMALLRIHPEHELPFVTFGDSDKVRVGDATIVIGSPFGFDSTVTSGIVSAVNRDIMESPFDDYIQTDAAINHGNSGGPMFNLQGEVIGMNSVIIAPGTGSVGLGFALPSNALKFTFDRLMKTGEIRAGMLPIHTQQVNWMLKEALDTPDLQGAMVTSVQDDGGAMLHGKIKPGDVIRSFNGETVWDPRDLARKAASAPVGSDAMLGVSRVGADETVHVTIQRWPETKPVAVGERHQQVGVQLASTVGENGQPVVTVASVETSGTAADSGIQKGDIIVEIQQTPVSDPDQATQVFRARSSEGHHFAAVLVERDKKFLWIPVAIPN
jgi:serine protease Do